MLEGKKQLLVEACRPVGMEPIRMRLEQLNCARRFRSDSEAVSEVSELGVGGGGGHGGPGLPLDYGGIGGGHGHGDAAGDAFESDLVGRLMGFGDGEGSDAEDDDILV